MNSQNLAEPISVQQLDQLVGRYCMFRKIYEEKRKEASDASERADKLEMELLDLLKQSGKSKYSVDGIGTVSTVSKLQFLTPKSPEDKKSLFDHIHETYGEEVLMGLLSINSQSLNSFFKEVVETPPGLEAPTCREYISLRRD